MGEERIRVLLIEELEDDARVVRQMLGAPEWSRFLVTHVESVAEGLAWLSEEDADVILLGIAVPGALAVKIVNRVHSHAPDVPVIALTTIDETEVMLEAARGGAVDHLVKANLDPRQLSRAIRYAVERTSILAARRRAEASLREVVTSSADAMVVVDAEGVVRFTNPAAEKLFGRDAGEFVGTAFDFDVSSGETREVEITRPGDGAAVAEMRVVPTEWEGESAYLASLRDMTESVRMREELRSLSLRDDLTGLYNRRGFATLAEQQLKLARRTPGVLLLIFADLDGLKAINDQFGHAEGDRALKRTAEVLTAAFRDSDIVARVGGDEFAVLAVGASSVPDQVVAERIGSRLRARLPVEGMPYKLSLSVGSVHYDAENPCSLDELLARADRVMYEQKRKGNRA